MALDDDIAQKEKELEELKKKKEEQEKKIEEGKAADEELHGKKEPDENILDKIFGLS